MKSQRSTKKSRGVFEKEPGSGEWWIQYYADGRRHREKAGTKSNAIDLYRKRKTQALGGQKLPEKLRTRAVTFQKIADAALEYSRAEKGSYQHDVYRMAPLSEHFGQRSAESILPEEFEGWLNEQAEEREWSVATKNRYTALLKLTYRLAEKNRKVKVNPARLLRMPKENNVTVRYLNQHKPLPTKVEYLKECQTEEDRLRAVIHTEYPNHLLEFEIALATGMRRSEMYGATWRNVDFEHDLLTVPRSKHGETRHVTLNSAARTMLEFLREKAGESEYVFLSMRNNEPLTGNRHWFEGAVKKAGVKDFTWHCLRHSFGSRLASRGIDLRKIQELMGHKTVSVTVRYTHLSQPDLRAAVEQLVPSGKPTATTTATGQKAHSEDSSMEAKQDISIQ
jgi:site-specific recombinase XerD